MILNQKPRGKSNDTVMTLRFFRINMEDLTIFWQKKTSRRHILVHAMYRSNGAIWSSRCVPPRGTGTVAYHHRIGWPLGAATSSSSSTKGPAWGAGAAVAFSRATWMRFQGLVKPGYFKDHSQELVLQWLIRLW